METPNGGRALMGADQCAILISSSNSSSNILSDHKLTLHCEDPGRLVSIIRVFLSISVPGV